MLLKIALTMLGISGISMLISYIMTKLFVDEFGFIFPKMWSETEACIVLWYVVSKIAAIVSVVFIIIALILGLWV